MSCKSWCNDHPADWIFSKYDSNRDQDSWAKCRYKTCDGCVFTAENENGDTRSFDCSTLHSLIDTCPLSRAHQSRGCGPRIDVR